MKLKYVILALAAMTGSASAVTLIDNSTRNGSFEDPFGVKVFFVDSAIPSWTNWAEQDTADNDTGADFVSAGTVIGLHGDRVAFIQPGGAILNMTSYIIQDGDVIDYSFNNVLLGRVDAIISLAYEDGGAMTQIAGTDVIASPLATGTGQLTVTAGDAWIGKTLGVGIVSTGNWPEVDQISLVVTPVPEPSSAALLGLGGLALVLRRRK